ncbi:hypothetical protein D3C75_1094440 [compost metagenome]
MLIQPWQFNVQTVIEDLKAPRLVWMAEHPQAVVKVALEFHETDGAKTIEPAVGRLLHGLGKA